MESAFLCSASPKSRSIGEHPCKILCLKIEQKCRQAVSHKVHKGMNNYIGLMDKIFTNGDGIEIASRNGGNRMKRNRQILKPRKFSGLSLGDLILAVSSCASSSRETVATVADLFASGRVRLQDNGRSLRVRVC
jgi:hypothetical protein